MPRSIDLFSRIELVQKTGIPDDVVNYWTREGVLRARVGGEGRGNPRRFDYPEIMLAAVLDQLRGFGLNVAALKGLSGRFHDALDYFREKGLTNENHYELHTLIDRQRYIERGLGSFGHTREPENFPQYEWKENKHRPGLYIAEIPFEDLLEESSFWQSPDATEEDVRLAIDLINKIDSDEYDTNYWYWSLLTKIDKQYYSGEPSHFARDSRGDWQMLRGDPSRRSWISIDTSAINYDLWRGDQGLRE